MGLIIILGAMVGKGFVEVAASSEIVLCQIWSWAPHSLTVFLCL